MPLCKLFVSCIIILMNNPTGTSAKWYTYDTEFVWPEEAIQWLELKPGQLGHFQTKLKVDSMCSQYYTLVIWSDNDTFLADLKYARSVSDLTHRYDFTYYCHNVFETVSYIIETYTYFSSKPECVSVEGYSTDILHTNEHTIRKSRLTLNLEPTCELNHTWIVNAFIGVSDDPRAPVYGPGQQFVLKSLLKYYAYVDLAYVGASKAFQMHLVTFELPSLCESLSVNKYEVQYMCFHNGEHIYANDSIKYITLFTKETTNSTVTLTMKLQIKRFDLNDYGLYYCIVKHLNQLGKCVSRYRTAIICISQTWHLMANDTEVPSQTWIFQSQNNIFFSIGLKSRNRIIRSHKLFETWLNGISSYGIILIILLISVIMILLLLVYIVFYVPYERQKDRDTVMKHISKLNKDRPRSFSNIYKYDVYISYHPGDKEFVVWVLEKLEDRGYKVCFERDMLYEYKLIPDTEEAIEHSRRFIAICSPEYYGDEWCIDRELIIVCQSILHAEAPSETLIIIKYRPCKISDLLTCLKRYTCLDWTDRDKRYVFVDELCRAIGSPQ